MKKGFLQKPVSARKTIFYFLLAIMMLSTAVACNKADDEPEEDGSEYFVKAKINGTWVEFKTENQTGSLFGPMGTNSKFFGGIWGQKFGEAAIGIDIVDHSPIKVGKYEGYQLFETPENYWIGAIIGFTGTVNETITGWVTNPNNPVSTVTFTQYTDKVARGTFSGTIVNPANLQNTAQVTEGSFFVKLPQQY
jgi:hypothetical protein